MDVVGVDGDGDVAAVLMVMCGGVGVGDIIGCGVDDGVVGVGAAGVVGAVGVVADVAVVVGGDAGAVGGCVDVCVCVLVFAVVYGVNYDGVGDAGACVVVG